MRVVMLGATVCGRCVGTAVPRVVVSGVVV